VVLEVGHAPPVAEVLVGDQTDDAQRHEAPAAEPPGEEVRELLVGLGLAADAHPGDGQHDATGQDQQPAERLAPIQHDALRLGLLSRRRQQRLRPASEHEMIGEVDVFGAHHR